MADYIEMCKKQTLDALDSFLLDLSFVPDDKLHWSPVPTAKSAFQIAAHCAGYSVAFAAIIRAGGFPWSRDEFRAPILARIESIRTMEEAEAMLRKGIDETLAALDAVKPEQISSSIDAPHATAPFTFFLTLPAMHLSNHEAQIDYLQTCWDDQEVHF